METIINPLTLIFGLLLASLLLSIIRLVRGPSLPDRVIALDLLTVIVISLIAVMAVNSRLTLFLDAAIVLALVAFVGTVAFARYVERRSQYE